MKMIHVRTMLVFLVISLFLADYSVNAAEKASYNKMQYKYDANGRLDSVCTKILKCTFFDYDKNGNLRSKDIKRLIQLPNPSFESGIADMGYYLGSGSLEVDTSVAHTGTKSVKAVPSPTGATWQLVTHDFETTIEGRKFTVSSNVKTSNLEGGVSLRIYWMDQLGNWIWSNITESKTLSGTNEWTKLSTTSIAPYGAIAITAILVAKPGTGTYWLDSFEAAEEASAPIPFPNPSFESGIADMGYYLGSGSLEVDTSVANTGTKSLKAVPSPTGTTYQLMTHEFETTIEGRKFTVSSYVKTSNLEDGVSLRIYWMDQSGNWIWSNITESNTLTGTNEWTKLSTTSIAPYGAIAVTAMLVAKAGTGTYWLDSFGAAEEASAPIPFPNPSFESGITEMGYYMDSGSLEVDTSVAHTGTKSLKAVPSPTGTTYQLMTHEFETTIEGRKLTVSSYVKTSNLEGGVFLRIYWMDQIGNWIWSNITESNTLSGTNEWTKLSTTSIAPYGAVSVTAMLVAKQGTGTYWLDSFEAAEEIIEEE